jgi:hypothetical protein
MISPAVINALVAAGCSAEQLAAALKASRAADKAALQKCSVYRLVDPRTIERKIFYVGVASDPMRRFRNHMYDPCSAAYRTIRSIMDAGFDQLSVIEIEGIYQSRADALRIESGLIQSTSGLVNRAGVQK